MADLRVETIHFYHLQNAADHHTDGYEMLYDPEMPIAVLRRGQKFTVCIRFSGRQYSPDIDNVSVIFNFVSQGSKPDVIKGTKAIIKLKSNTSYQPDGRYWSGAITSDECDLMIEICPAVDCPVGIWRVQVQTSTENSVYEPTLYDRDDTLYILFNPWHKDDLVYMADERLLDEYITMDVGKIWIGDIRNSRGREWVFGQFDACVLPATMLMLENSNMTAHSRGDPIKLTRIISKMVNTNDEDNGVVVGRWDGDYIDGTAPSAWTGSADILREYLETGLSVSYGQCWVFAGVVGTVCRALGIPCRVVSNLVSAHDANTTLTIDKYYDENNDEMIDDPMNEYGGTDSIWNYHVWNDVWMKRPDLGEAYGGWQAIDSTPQEQSSGIYQCGPASLEAIRKGEVGYSYDVAFMVSSVNADLMRWKKDPKSELGYSKIYTNKYHIGRMLMTKKPWIFDPNGDQDKEDVTLQYKPAEGTPEERQSLYNAVRSYSLAAKFYGIEQDKLEEIEFELLDIERINIGEDFSVVVIATNKCESVRTFKLQLSARSVYYNGSPAHQIDKIEGTVQLKPQTSDKLELLITGDKYLDKLVEYSIVKLCAVATVEETSHTWADEDDFQIVKPTINVKVLDEIPINQPTPVILRFVNPLATTLTSCKFTIAGPTLVKSQSISYPDVKPKSKLHATCEITPRKTGSQKIIVVFDSIQLRDITGSAVVDVYEE